MRHALSCAALVAVSACGGRLLDVGADAAPPDASLDLAPCTGLGFKACYAADCIWMLHDRCDELADAAPPSTDLVVLPADGCYPRWPLCGPADECAAGTTCRYVVSGSGCAPPEDPPECTIDDEQNLGEACRYSKLCLPSP